MVKEKFGIAVERDLLRKIDERRETDQANPGFQTRSEFIEELLTYGLCVERLFHDGVLPHGDMADKPAMARNFVDIAVRRAVAEEYGVELDPGDVPVQTTEYMWE